MDVAFVGCGDIADRYASDLPSFDSLRLVGVADVERDRADALADRTGCDAFSDVATMLEDADPELVVNLTSHEAHAGVTRTCLEAGVNVYSEKPLAFDPSEARELVDIAVMNGLGLGVAPVNHRGEQQRLSARRLADGTLGAVRVVSATAHVGRVTEWHDRPASFLKAGPLFDGAVYPLTLLVEWFGPVSRIRTADASTPYPSREGVVPDTPTHVEATLDIQGGPLVRLTASFYVPHSAREFYGIEVHGDDASLYLEDAGDLGGGREHLVFVGRAGQEYTPVPLQQQPRETSPVAGVAALVDEIRQGEPAVSTGRRAAHVVSVCDAVERVAESNGPISVDRCGFEPAGLPDVRIRPDRQAILGSADRARDAAIRLPPLGFGCSRYRNGEYVDRTDSIETALDAGYRLLDSAELYGNEARIGEILRTPGSPNRESLVLLSKVWNTNHGHVREACETTLAALGVDTLDSYLLHWPESWKYTGPLRELADVPVEEREAKTFPRDENGDPISGGVPLEVAWRGLESVQKAGLTRTIGICNVDDQTLGTILDIAEISPSVVQVESHPYSPREELIDRCHAQGIRVIAHSPLSAPGLLSDPIVGAIAEEYDASPAQVVLAWHISRGVVPIPSSVDREHVVENAAAPAIGLDGEARARIDELADPSFER